MSYQIKSTPYFRRMFNNSKKNGQLQRLREEYERIQEFNDRTIELKMRQVRLKRLFREIEEIKEGGGPVAGASNSANTATRASGGGSASASSASNSARRRHHHHPHQRYAGITPEQRRFHQRAETLIRSRELGKQLSRRNAQRTDAGVGGLLRADLRATAKMKAVADARRDALERRERAAKRISYGNDQSRQNLQRQLMVCQRRLIEKHQPHHLHPMQEIGLRQQRLLRPDYRTSQDEEELAAEQQRYFREQEEDELQLAEERFRRQEERLRLEAEYSEEGQEDQEELRFLRGEQALSATEQEGNEIANERRQQPQLELAAERFRLQEECLRLEADYSEEEQEDPEEGHRRLKQVDEKEAEQQRRWLHVREKTSLPPLARFSLSSTTTENPLRPAQNTRSHYYRNHHPQYLQATFSSDQEMRTAPLATEEHMASLVGSRSTTNSGYQPPQPVPRNALGAEKDTDPEADQLPALNNWRRVSLMMPWFKVFPPRKSACPVPRSFAGPTDKQAQGADPAEPQPSMINQPHQQ